MGAENFEVYSLGRDADSAFKAIQDEAFYMYGHAGYTGTIAEKPGYVFAGAVNSHVGKHLENYFFRVTEGAWDVDQSNDGKIPPSVKPLIHKYAETWDDKWGPAVCFEITGRMAKDFRDKAGRKGTMDKLYTFLGWASS